MDKTRLQKVLDLLDPDQGLGNAFKTLENEIKKVTDKTKRDAESQATDFAKKNITELKNELKANLDAITQAVSDLEIQLQKTEQSLNLTFSDRVASLQNTFNKFQSSDSEKSGSLKKELDALRASLQELSDRKVEIPDFGKDIKSLRSNVDSIVSDLKNIRDEELTGQSDFQKKLDTLVEDFKKLRSDVVSRSGRGGNANRNILVGGNSSTLSRYTDLNIKAGANVTLTYTNNDNLKTTDLTIASSGGGGGSVIGTTRSINNIAVSQGAGDTSGTDYVYICTAGVTLTMPTAAANTNLYTIKNTSTSSVLVATTGAEKIDTQSNAILSTQYTSIDLISDGSNWEIT